MPDRPTAGRRQPTSVLLAIAAAGVVLRLAFGLAYWTNQPLTRDEQEYLSLARGLAAGRGFTYDNAVQSNTFLPFGRAPGYPVFLALVGGGAAAATSVPAPVKIAQSIVGGLGVFMAGLIGWRLGGRGAAIAASSVAAIYPPLVWTAAYALSEALFWPIGLLTAWVIDRSMAVGGSSGRWLALTGGAITGAGILIRPGLLLFVPLLLAWMAWRRRFVRAAAITAGLLLVLLPWTARNYARYGRVILVASDGGVTFWTGNHPLATGDGDMAANPALKLANESLRARYPGLSEEAMEPVYYREAFAWIREHPFDWAGLELRKLLYLVVPIGGSYRVHSRLYFGASVVSYGLLLCLAIGGLVRLGGRLARTPALWLMALSAVAAVLVFFMQERFRIPTIDPTLVVLAGSAWADRGRS